MTRSNTVRGFAHQCLAVVAVVALLDEVLSLKTSLLGPSFSVEPSSFVDFSNSSGTFIKCSAEGLPPPLVYWMASEGSKVHNVTKLRTVYPNGTIELHPFRADDYSPDVHSASYRCAASNTVGTIVSKAVHIRAVVLQNYEAQVYDDFVIRGNTAILRCQIPSFVAEYVRVTAWILDSTFNLEVSKSNDEKYTILPYGELYIRNVEPNDGLQSYHCRTEHKLTGDVRLSATAGRVVVTEPTGSVSPRITDSRSILHAKKGETLVLPCSAQGYPPPIYSWFRKSESGKLTPISSNEKYTQLEGLLTLSDVDETDAGIYVCLVKNNLGDEKVETNVAISVPLSAQVEPLVNIVEKGRSATVHCVVYGFPVTSVTWLKNGKVLPTAPTSNSGRYIMRIESVQREDCGMYQCFVNNNYEAFQATAEIRMGDSSPEMVERFSEQLLRPASAMALKCSATGVPTPLFVWTLDSLPLPVNEKFHIEEYIDKDGNAVSYVSVSKVQVEDGGLYQCAAVNKAGRVLHAARVNVYGLPFIRALPKLNAVEGLNMTLTCPAAGYPIDSITWERDGSKLPLNHRQKLFSKGTLLVLNVQRSLDQGKYTCIASSNQGQSSRRDFEVFVTVPPKVIPFSFQDDLIYEGMRATVFCAVSQGDSPITIRWYKDGSEIPSYLDVRTQPLEKYGSTLSIERVTSAHQGNFTCSASNPAATVNHTAHLTVNVPPRWVIEPQDASVLSGKDLQVDCLAEGFPTPTVTWMKATDDSAGEYTDVERLRFRFAVTSKGTLKVTNAQEGDEGRYMCKASNGIGAGLSKVIFVNVKVPSRFNVKHRNHTVPKGQEAQLSCTAKGDVPLEIIWRMNGRSISTGPQSRFRLQEYILDKGLTSHLIISNVDRPDTATFSCIAKNPFGHDESVVNLFVQERPEAAADIWITDHGSRNFQLSWMQPYHGNSPVIAYIIQYKPISANWSTGSTNISIPGEETSASVRGLRPSTTYNIRVFVVNEVGTSDASKAVTLTTAEEAPGGAPRDVKVEAIDSQTFKVTWKPPRKESWNGEIRGYHVGFRLYNSTEPHVYKTLQMTKGSETELKMSIITLKKFTKYGIVVQAYNDHGIGPNSDEIMAVTCEDVPSQAPLGLHCSPMSSQSLHVLWESPSESEINGMLAGYKVIYQRVEELHDGVPPETKITAALKTMLHGLQKHANYSIKVLAFTRVGDGAKSEAVFCQTQEDVPNAPSALKAVVSSPESIIVTWKPPQSPNGAIVKYTVYMRFVDNSKEETSKYIVAADESLYEVIGLKKNRRYEFWVTASTQVGEGQSTRVVSQTTIGPTVAAKIPLLDDRVVTTWKKEVQLKCIAVGIPQPSTKWLFGGQPLQTRGRISFLPSGTALLIRDVQSEDAGNYTCIAKNDLGSDSVTYQLVIEVPPDGPVMSVVATSMTSLKIQWRMSSDGGRPIRGFTLSYRQEYGQWSEVEIESGVDVYTLSSLTCGTRYQLFMTASNVVGVGQQSETVSTRTKGTVPEAPRKEKLITENSTFIILNLESWYDGGCPILYFVVEYRRTGPDLWTLVSNNVKADQSRFVVADLSPSTAYSLRMTAHSSAGSNVDVYEFVTLNYMGDAPPSMNIRSDNESASLQLDFGIVISTALALVIVLVAVVIACLCARRRKRSAAKKNSDNMKMRKRYLVPDMSSDLMKGIASWNANHQRLISNNVNCGGQNQTTESQNSVTQRGFSDITPYVGSQQMPGARNENSISTTTNDTRSYNFCQQEPAIDSLYSKVEKEAVTICPKHHGNRQADIEVPDVLDHSFDSNSCEENSPERSYRLVGVADGNGDVTRQVWKRLDHDKRYSGESAETTFTFSSEKDLQHGTYYCDIRELSEAECDREVGCEFTRRQRNHPCSMLLNKRYPASKCSYRTSNARRYKEEYTLPI